MPACSSIAWKRTSLRLFAPALPSRWYAIARLSTFRLRRPLARLIASSKLLRVNQPWKSASWITLANSIATRSSVRSTHSRWTLVTGMRLWLVRPRGSIVAS